MSSVAEEASRPSDGESSCLPSATSKMLPEEGDEEGDIVGASVGSSVGASVLLLFVSSLRSSVSLRLRPLLSLSFRGFVLAPPCVTSTHNSSDTRSKEQLRDVSLIIAESICLRRQSQRSLLFHGEKQNQLNCEQVDKFEARPTTL